MKNIKHFLILLSLISIPLVILVFIGSSCAPPESFVSFTNLNIVDTTKNSASFQVDYAMSDNSDILQIGCYYGTNPDPSDADNLQLSSSPTVAGATEGTFDLDLSGLTPGTLYYIKFFIEYKGSDDLTHKELSPPFSFTTLMDGIPVVTTTSVSAITLSTATASGIISDSGGTPILEKGICYSTSAGPNTSDLKVIVSGGLGAFTANLAGLSASTTYFTRAYARNSIGTAYGSDVTFTTLSAPPVLSTITTTAITSITAITASGGGNVSSDGGATISERGICYSTSASPTILDTKVISSGTTGLFTSSLTSLTASTTYYVRAYATNIVGTAYGADESFTTTISGSLATVTTSTTVSIASTTALGCGNITSDGGASITERGICYSLTPTPSTADLKSIAAGTTGGFTANLIGLVPNTTYHVRAYAINGIGTAYGVDGSFTTLP